MADGRLSFPLQSCLDVGAAARKKDGELLFGCPICGHTAKWNASLKRHMLSQHNAVVEGSLRDTAKPQVAGTHKPQGDDDISSSKQRLSAGPAPKSPSPEIPAPQPVPSTKRRRLSREASEFMDKRPADRSRHLKGLTMAQQIKLAMQMSMAESQTAIMAGA